MTAPENQPQTQPAWIVDFAITVETMINAARDELKKILEDALKGHDGHTHSIEVLAAAGAQDKSFDVIHQQQHNLAVGK